MATWPCSRLQQVNNPDISLSSVAIGQYSQYSLSTPEAAAASAGGYNRHLPPFLCHPSIQYPSPTHRLSQENLFTRVNVVYVKVAPLARCSLVWTDWITLFTRVTLGRTLVHLYMKDPSVTCKIRLNNPMFHPATPNTYLTKVSKPQKAPCTPKSTRWRSSSNTLFLV